MTAPFYNSVKGTTSGAPGTGAFTPNAPASGFRAWSTVPSGWIGMVRYDDGAAWELCYSYWNGTTLSRAATQLFDSSSGSAISLTSAATACMVADGSEIMSHVATTAWSLWLANANQTTGTLIGCTGPTTSGTATAANVAATNYLTEQQRVQYNSVTTASGQAGFILGVGAGAVYSTSSGRGGFEMTARWGAAQLPTAPRLLVGMRASSYGGSTAEPSATIPAGVMFAKDSTDTNIQLMVFDGTNAPAKVDTGIPLVANGWYESSVWAEPGGGAMYALLVRLDTGDIYYKKTTSGLPPTGTTLSPNIYCGLNGTNTGTAAFFCIGSVGMRRGE